MRIFWHRLSIGVVALLASCAAYAQRPPAIPGLTGTVVTKETIRQEHKLANRIVVAAEDGVEYLFPAAKGPLSDLPPGAAVAIYFESAVTEAIVSEVNVGKNEITLRYENGTRDTFQLVDSEDRDTATHRIVYRSDRTNGRVARYFRLKS
jgi:hypothetical protein